MLAVDIAITEGMSQVHELQSCVCVALSPIISLFGARIDTRIIQAIL